ncbi:hypothetical protein [Candidatus Thiodictyon syntrophicum]|jgi:hypothetical protein|uniref:Uncharacterized protein n=1 Tax=Candidatus Thiodictyon syntrophicum TaxID=1166950 RepID=A0A2K8U6X7_9GAMM|nr:hypothetical protein [Candidatus Thiodictyon syntrophicum]AUB81169.1 hypothetical protein THSYN_09525 [Candidatus Thiodictyon syntrophicum]
MTDQTARDDTGLIVTLLERLRKQRLPRVLDLKAKVDAGGTLDSFDFDFLHEVFADANRLRPLWERHPEFNDIAGQLIRIYREITERALANETGANETGATPT